MPLDKEDIERLKEIFVERQECNNSMDAMDEKINSNINAVNDKINTENIRLAVIEHRLSVIAWLLMAVCGGIITTLVKLFLGG